jgi:hypothetical protein
VIGIWPDRETASSRSVISFHSFFKILEPEFEPEFQLVPNCDLPCEESVRNNKVTQSNDECCWAFGFTKAHGCYGLDNRHAGAAVCYLKKGKHHNTTVCYKSKPRWGDKN